MENKPSSLKVRVAVVQAAPAMFDTQRSLQKLGDFTAAAAKFGARLVVFPEAFIAGYPKGHDFGVSVGIRSPGGRDEFRRLFESAVDVPSQAASFIGTIAKEHGVHVVVGVIEKDGGTLYCTALMLAPDGSLLGKHRKLMLTAMERVIWGTGDGSTLLVLASNIGKIGAVICWENYLPLLWTAVYTKGIELYCAITVDDRDTWLPSRGNTMNDEASYHCDSCGEEIVVPIDLTAGSRQEYVEDCPVCCRPNVIHVEIDEDGDVRVWAERE